MFDTINFLVKVGDSQPRGFCKNSDLIPLDVDKIKICQLTNIKVPSLVRYFCYLKYNEMHSFELKSKFLPA